jgi:hypothetical protein
VPSFLPSIFVVLESNTPTHSPIYSTDMKSNYNLEYFVSLSPIVLLSLCIFIVILVLLGLYLRIRNIKCKDLLYYVWIKKNTPDLYFVICKYINNKNNILRRKAFKYLSRNAHIDLDQVVPKRIYEIVEQTRDMEVRYMGVVLLCRIYHYHPEIISVDMQQLIQKWGSLKSASSGHALSVMVLNEYKNFSIAKAAGPSTIICRITVNDFDMSVLNYVITVNDEAIFNKSTVKLQMQRVICLYAILLERKRRIGLTDDATPESEMHLQIKVPRPDAIVASNPTQIAYFIVNTLSNMFLSKIKVLPTATANQKYIENIMVNSAIYIDHNNDDLDQVLEDGEDFNDVELGDCKQD